MVNVDSFFLSNHFVLILGVGGNLVAVQASRLSTALHQQGKPGEFQDNTQYQASKLCPNPYKTFFSNSMCILSIGLSIIL
jgi:hypothetical protein